METEGKFHCVLSEQEKDRLMKDMSRFAGGFTSALFSLAQVVSEKTNAHLWGMRYDTVHGGVSAFVLFELLSNPTGVIALMASGYDKIRAHTASLLVSPFISPQEQNCEELFRIMGRKKRIGIGLPSEKYQDVPLVYDSKRGAYAPWAIASFEDQDSLTEAVVSYVEVARQYPSQVRFVGLNYGQQIEQVLVFGYIPWDKARIAIAEDLGRSLIRLARSDSPVWEREEKRVIIRTNGEFFDISLTTKEEIRPQKSDDYPVLVFTPSFYIVWKQKRWRLVGNRFFVVQTTLAAEDYLRQQGEGKFLADCRQLLDFAN